jgi:hypothetical protein
MRMDAPTRISDKEEEVEVLIGFKDADWGIEFEPDETKRLTKK